jgi:hypothetical protein
VRAPARVRRRRDQTPEPLTARTVCPDALSGERSRWKVRASVRIVLEGSAHEGGAVANFKVNINTTAKFNAQLKLVSWPDWIITSDDVGCWTYTVFAGLSGGPVNDSAWVTVLGTHKDAPHGEAPNGAMGLMVNINADDFREDVHTVSKSVAFEHESHYDVWYLTVKFRTTSTLGFDGIEWVDALIDMVHTEDRPKGEIRKPDWGTDPNEKKIADAISRRLKAMDPKRA